MTVDAACRALSAALEPAVGSVYFAKEAHDAFAALGHGPTTGQMTGGWDKEHWGSVLMTDYFAYFCGRGSILGGQVPGEVIASAFGVFSPAAVKTATEAGWPIADAAAMRAARDRGAVAQLKRILGDRPEGLDRANALLELAGSRLRVEGRPMYAGVLAQGLPDEPVLRMWRLAERLREFRGDAFVHAFVHHGFDGCEIQVLTERLAGFPPHTYSVTRGWSAGELDAAAERLAGRGLLTAYGGPTDAGFAAREEVEETVDRYCRSMVDALGGDDGGDLPELVGIFQAWNAKLRAEHGYYPSSPQEQVLHPAVNAWMVEHGLPPFGRTAVDSKAREAR